MALYFLRKPLNGFVGVVRGVAEKKERHRRNSLGLGCSPIFNKHPQNTPTLGELPLGRMSN